MSVAIARCVSRSLLFENHNSSTSDCSFSRRRFSEKEKLEIVGVLSAPFTRTRTRTRIGMARNFDLERK